MILILLIFVSFGLVSLRNYTQTGEYLPFEIPKGWPKPVFNFEKNKLSKAGFELGKKLFYDPILSKDNTISCASCHTQQTAFAHSDHPLSHGIEDKIGTRNALTIQNLAWTKRFHWDGGVASLEAQPINPITSPTEMDSNLNDVLAKLNESKQYKKMFFTTFGDSIIKTKTLLKALSQFTVSLVSSNSKYDKVQRGEEIFSDQEKNGFDLFQKNCASCHRAPLFTNDGFADNGLPIDKDLKDFGRVTITKNIKDSFNFRVPTLRNIEFSAPYMHDGRFMKLKEVLQHYVSGKQNRKTLAKELSKPINLTNNDQKDIIAFLLTLTDKNFLFDKRFSYPKEY